MAISRGLAIATQSAAKARTGNRYAASPSKGGGKPIAVGGCVSLLRELELFVFKAYLGLQKTLGSASDSEGRRFKSNLL